MTVGQGGKFVPAKMASGPSELGPSEAQGSAAKAKAKAVSKKRKKTPLPDSAEQSGDCPSFT
eukprot:11584095-Alexandrium_andersonii.AAC.1